MGIDWGGGGILEGNGCGGWTGSCTSVCWMGQCPAGVRGAASHVHAGTLQWREPSEGKEVVGEEQYCRGGLGGRQVCCAGPSWDAAVIYVGEHVGGAGILGKEYVGQCILCLVGSQASQGASQLWEPHCGGRLAVVQASFRHRGRQGRWRPAGAFMGRGWTCWESSYMCT
jgi:hypothetical protein